jgi:hypothetical protein
MNNSSITTVILFNKYNHKISIETVKFAAAYKNSIKEIMKK